MSGQFRWTDKQVERLKSYFPKAQGRPHEDDRRVLSVIIHILRNGARWQDAPSVCWPNKTLQHRFVRWSRLGVSARIFRDLVTWPSQALRATHLRSEER